MVRNHEVLPDNTKILSHERRFKIQALLGQFSLRLRLPLLLTVGPGPIPHELSLSRPILSRSRMCFGIKTIVNFKSHICVVRSYEPKLAVHYYIS